MERNEIEQSPLVGREAELDDQSVSNSHLPVSYDPETITREKRIVTLANENQALRNETQALRASALALIRELHTPTPKLPPSPEIVARRLEVREAIARRDRSVQDTAAQETADQAIDGFEQLARRTGRSFRAGCEEAFDSLTAREYDVISACFLAEKPMTPTQAAEHFKLSLITINAAILRGVKKLQTALEPAPSAVIAPRHPVSVEDQLSQSAFAGEVRTTPIETVKPGAANSFVTLVVENIALKDRNKTLVALNDKLHESVVERRNQNILTLSQFTPREAAVVSRLHLPYEQIAIELSCDTEHVERMVKSARERIGRPGISAREFAIVMYEMGFIFDINPPPKPLVEILTNAQMEMGVLLAEGLSYAAVAEKLQIDEAEPAIRAQYIKFLLKARSHAEVALMIRTYDTGKRRRLDGRPPSQELSALLGLSSLAECFPWLAFLTDKQRAAVKIFYLSERDVSYSEIAARFDITSDAVGRRLKSAVKCMRAAIASQKSPSSVGGHSENRRIRVEKPATVKADDDAPRDLEEDQTVNLRPVWKMSARTQRAQERDPSRRPGEEDTMKPPKDNLSDTRRPSPGAGGTRRSK